MYGRVEDISQLWTAAGITREDYVFWLCLDREGFQGIPDIIYHKDRQMIVVVEGRRSNSCYCKQVGQIAKVCPQKAPKQAKSTQPLRASEVDATKETSEAENQPSR